MTDDLPLNFLLVTVTSTQIGIFGTKFSAKVPNRPDTWKRVYVIKIAILPKIKMAATAILIIDTKHHNINSTTSNGNWSSEPCKRNSL